METHLLSFVERVRCLSEDQIISKEFTLVREKSKTVKEDYGLTNMAGESKENTKKNRYKDILPYDQTRVCLTPTTSEYESDYINANFVKGAFGNRKYIATQGPLRSTVVDFWRMIWQYNVKVIIMACREIEMGRKKCEVYWTSTTEQPTYGPFTVSILEEFHTDEEIIVRTLVVKYFDETRKVSHFQYTAWPDHGIPYMPDGILGLMELARRKQSDQTAPVVIHCSAGCGRTGVICAIDYVNDLLLSEQIKEDFNILDLVIELRRQRPSAVQTKEQYEFVFHTVAQMFEKVLQQRNKNTKTSDSLYINALPPKTPVKSGSLSRIDESQKTRNPPLNSRFSHPSAQSSMNDTYAVVNKTKLHIPAVHQYDNDHLDKGNKNALYSTVKPKNRPVSSLPTTPAYDRPTANQRGGLGSGRTDNEGYELLPGMMKRDTPPRNLSRSSSASASHSSTDDDYEYVSSNIQDTSSLFAPSSLGFNSRVKKPKGPRDPPAEWGRAER